MDTKERYYELDDIGFIGSQEPMSAEEKANGDALVHAFIQQQKAKQTPEESEYYSAFGNMIRAIDRFKQAKRKMTRTVTA